MAYNFDPQNELLSSYAPRVAIVTGAARGIGYTIAHQLAEDGIDIAINDIPANAERIDVVVSEIRALGRRAAAIPADVSNEESVKEMIAKTVKELGSVDIMIANAGIVEFSPFLETTAESFDKHLNVNLRGVFLCYKHAALQMIKQGRGGRIVGASSSSGKEAALNLTAYTASKFGIRGITQTAALELRRYGITVNCYAPGVIFSALTTSGAAGSINDQTAGVKKLIGFSEDTPTAEPDCIANLVSYLVKPQSYFVTAQTLSVDGGVRPS